MDRDFTKRPFRPMFRYGDGGSEDKGHGGTSGTMAPNIFGVPFYGGDKGPTFDLPLPGNHVNGAGHSRAITAADGPATYEWCIPASGIRKPTGGVK